MKTPAFGDDIIDVDVVVDVDAVLVVVVQRVQVPLLAAVGRAAASRWPTTTNDERLRRRRHFVDRRPSLPDDARRGPLLLGAADVGADRLFVAAGPKLEFRHRLRGGRNR